MTADAELVMYNINDTITAISSASPGGGLVAKSIIRISGKNTTAILNDIFCGKIKSHRGITPGSIQIGGELKVEAIVYSFKGPNSYTGEDLAEIHIFAAEVVVKELLEQLSRKARLAGPGEFTLRAYFNGKMDLAQAEAVAEIVASSNQFQLAAAQKLLAGKLSETVGQIRSRILDILSLVEAGMDFSTEDIEFVTNSKAIETIARIKDQLNQVLNGSIRYEEMIGAPSVGLAGAPNAGKSSLLNALLREDRGIVSENHSTTRDVLTGILELKNNNCALFDCAGIFHNDQAGILDGLAQQAAVEALNSADIVLLCVDITKTNFAKDSAISTLLEPTESVLVATKCDLLDENNLSRKLNELNTLYQINPIATSAVSGAGLDGLRSVIDKILITLRSSGPETDESIATTQRHRLAVQEAIKNLDEALGQINAENNEVAAMLLRLSYQQLSQLEKEDINQEVLERIFSNFCIGK